MTLPTVLNPWYVVYKTKSTEKGEVFFYYSAAEDGTMLFDIRPKRAMMIQSLHTAARIAASEGANIRVLVSADDASEFGRY